MAACWPHWSIPQFQLLDNRSIITTNEAASTTGKILEKRMIFWIEAGRGRPFYRFARQASGASPSRALKAWRNASGLA